MHSPQSRPESSLLSVLQPVSFYDPLGHSGSSMFVSTRTQPLSFQRATRTRPCGDGARRRRNTRPQLWQEQNTCENNRLPPPGRIQGCRAAVPLAHRSSARSSDALEKLLVSPRDARRDVGKMARACCEARHTAQTAGGVPKVVFAYRDGAEARRRRRIVFSISTAMNGVTDRTTHTSNSRAESGTVLKTRLRAGT